VNSYTSGTQSLPAVAMNDGGAFVIVWRSGPGQDGSDYGVFGRRFSSTGSAQATEFQANAYVTGPQGNPAVAIDDQGEFVVIWQGTGASGSGIFGRRFGSNGAALAGDFQANVQAGSTKREPALASDSDGDFVVSWDSRDQDGSSYGIFARRFDSMGAAVGTEFQVNTYTTFEQIFSTVGAADDGAFVVAWQSPRDTSGYGVFARRFTSAGSPLGPEFQVAQRTIADQTRPSIERRRRRLVPRGVD
jgi:hypothetical protein